MAQSKHARMVDDILNSGKEIDHEPTLNFLKDMHQRFRKNPNFQPSYKQGKWIEKSYRINIEGMSPRDVAEQFAAPDKYDNCEMIEERDGFFIAVEGETVGEPVANSEARIILAWLTKTIPLLKSKWNGHHPTSVTEDEEPPYFAEGEEPPDDTEFPPQEPKPEPTKQRPF